MHVFYNVGSRCLTILYKHFDFIDWFDLNSNSNSLFEIMSINDFLVDSSVNFLFDSLIWLYILPVSVELSRSFSSELIIINSLSSSFFNFFLSFYLIVNISVSCVLFHQLLLLIYAQKNINQFYILKQSIVAIFFHLQIFLLFFLNTDWSLVIIIPCWLNPNLDLNSIAVGVLQSIIIDKLGSSQM